MDIHEMRNEIRNTQNRGGGPTEHTNNYNEGRDDDGHRYATLRRMLRNFATHVTRLWLPDCMLFTAL